MGQPTPPGRKVVHSTSLGIERADLSADIFASDTMVTQEPTGEGMRDVRLADIQQRIGRDEYHVDTQAVAAAILRRLLSGDRIGLGGEAPPQDRCS